jgi:hypothetical protein
MKYKAKITKIGNSYWIRLPMYIKKSKFRNRKIIEVTV